MSESENFTTLPDNREPWEEDEQLEDWIDDPADIPDHDSALEVVAYLDRRISAITMKLDCATLEANLSPMSVKASDWFRRASYARAMAVQDRHRVIMRDKEIRGTKGPARTEKDPTIREANLVKQERLKIEAETKRAAKRVEIERQRTLQIQISEARRFNTCFVAVVRERLPPEQFWALQEEARRRHGALAGEAGTAETALAGSVHEHATPTGDAL